MKGFKEKTFADRLQEASDARKAALERFRSRPAADDPDVIKRREERLRIAQAREERETARRAQKEAEAEIARVVLALVESDFITGETIRVDGGRHLN